VKSAGAWKADSLGSHCKKNPKQLSQYRKAEADLATDNTL